MTNIYQLFLSCILFAIVGCDMIQHTYWSDDDYVVEVSPSDPSNKTLYIEGESGGHGRIDWVEKIGSNKIFIIAQSRENWFYILDKTKDSFLLNDNEIVMGPYRESEFKLKKAELKITDLEFSDEF